LRIVKRLITSTIFYTDNATSYNELEDETSLCVVVPESAFCAYAVLDTNAKATQATFNPICFLIVFILIDFMIVRFLID
jgi:hypothetical protein